MQPEVPAPRVLTAREKSVLIALIRRGTRGADEPEATDDDRARWLGQVPQTRAGRPCGCGTCPSITLCDPTGATPSMSRSRVVLEASTTEALLLLFVDDDRLSYLELAPLGDEASIHEFPDPQSLEFAE